MESGLADVASGEAQGVADDDEITESHGGGAEGWVDEAEGGEGDGGCVVEEGPEEVLANRGEGGPGEFQGLGNGGEVAAEEDQAGGFAGHVGGAGDGDAQVRSGECRAVVDAVTDERNAVSGGSKGVEESRLGFGGDPSVDMGRVDTDFGGDALRGVGLIAGKHSDPKASIAEAPDDLPRLGAYAVPQGEGANDGAVLSEQDRGGTFGERGLDEGLGRREVETESGEEGHRSKMQGESVGPGG